MPRLSEDGDPASEPELESGSSLRVLGLFALAAVLMIVGPLALSRLVAEPESTRYEFEIPAGTADALAAGRSVDVIPAELDLKLDDWLVLVNNDDRAHQVGVFTVEPGETLERRFAEATSAGGFCSLHSSGRIDIDIGPARS